MASSDPIVVDRHNDLPFSGERRTVVRSYHGREEPRALARGVAARPALERAAQAFSRCNGLLDGALFTSFGIERGPHAGTRDHPVAFAIAHDFAK